ncbi:MAG TPA: asparagine synthetase B, partial [Burkholderiales bacterium]|nr:asparagine synthetase B [Burkholderiales bacterium]
MCGICGMVDLQGGAADPDLLRQMAGTIRHRGPDETGIYTYRQAGLAHARLSIIDIATGRQPMCNEDQSLWIAFNGEIFNYIELRDELIAKGHR